jgi:hypothetical protein
MTNQLHIKELKLNIHYEAHSTALEESNIEWLLPTLIIIHNKLPVGITLDKLYGDIAECPHCGE